MTSTSKTRLAVAIKSSLDLRQNFSSCECQVYLACLESDYEGSLDKTSASEKSTEVAVTNDFIEITFCDFDIADLLG